MLAGFSQSGASVFNVYKKQADLTVAFNDLCSMLKGMSNLPIVITFSGVDRPFVMNFENIVRDATKRKTTVFHNKTLKANGFVSVYFGKE